MRKYNHSVGNDAKGIVMKRKDGSSDLLKKAMTSFAVVALCSIPIGVVKYSEARDNVAIKDNSCVWEETVANDNSSYRAWASEAIRESNDLGKRVGVNGIGEILYEKNNGRDIVSGEAYRILSCKSD